MATNEYPMTGIGPESLVAHQLQYLSAEVSTAKTHAEASAVITRLMKS